MKNVSFIISTLLLIILMSSKPAFCQENGTPAKSDSLSKLFSQITFGLSEIISFVAGYHIDRNNSIGLKQGAVWVSNKDFFLLPNSGSTIGIKYSRLFNYDFFLKQVNLSISTIYIVGIDKASFSVDTFNKGFSLECTTSNKINYKKGFSFIYELGFLATQLKGRKLLFWPSLKIGTNFNF